MNPFSVYRLTDGVLTGSVLRGSEYSIRLNTPPDCGVIPGEWDPMQYRVVDGQAVPHVTEAPAVDVDALWRDVRATRDALLQASDWVVLRASERGDLVPTTWIAYRQALRDITDQPDPSAIVWPVRPE